MRGAATVDGVAATSCGGGREPGAAVCVAALPAERCWSADGGGAGGQQAMVQVVDYGSVPAAASRPLASKARRAGFIRFAAVATLALGALAAVIVVGQTRPGTFVHARPRAAPAVAPLPLPLSHAFPVLGAAPRPAASARSIHLPALVFHARREVLGAIPCGCMFAGPTPLRRALA